MLEGASAAIQAGEMVVLLGRSGSGKSTLLHLGAGLDLPDSGDVLLEGRSLPGMTERERTRLRRDRVGFVFQAFNLIPTLTVEENLLLPIELRGAVDSAARRRALEILDAVGLADRQKSFPDRLSGGEQQRVAIARALAHDPALVLADEPTGNLDLDTGLEVLELLDRLTRRFGKTLVMVTHGAEVVGNGRPRLPPRPRTPARNQRPLIMRLLARSSRRYLTRRPLRLLLAIGGVALGVSVVVAIDLVNASATRAFRFSTEAIAGRATHQISGGSAGLDEALFARLVSMPGAPPLAPIVEDAVVVLAEDGRERPRSLRLLGVEPFSERPFRDFLMSAGQASSRRLATVDWTRLLREPGTVVLSRETARELKLEAGSAFRVRVGTSTRELRLLGTIDPADASVRAALSNLVFADIATAQETLGLDRTFDPDRNDRRR